MQKRRAQHGNIFKTSILGSKTIVMLGPEANQWIYAGENKYLQNRWSYAITQLLGTQALSILTGEAHKERRRILSPHFKYEAMSHFVPMIEALAKTHLARWAEQGGVLNIEKAMRRLAFEIIAVFIFGKDAPHLDLDHLSHHFAQWEAGMFTPLAWNVPFTAFGRAMQSKQALFETIKPLIEARRQSAQAEPDILGTLLAVRDSDGQGLSDETIIHEIQLMLFAGHDTTVTTNTNLMLLLSQHPAVLQCAREEQQQLNDGDEFTIESLKNMPYLEAVIQESMRLIPPINGMFRVMNEDREFGGYRIPKGWMVAINPRATHYDTRYWSNPETFDPGRWLHKEKNQQPPFCHIPFGGGPRLCLGQSFALIEMRLILALLLRHYQWELIPGQDLNYRAFPFPLPNSGVDVTFTRL